MPGRKRSLADKKPTAGEPKNRRMTVARRRRVEGMRASKNASGLQRGIKKSQRRRPY